MAWGRGTVLRSAAVATCAAALCACSLLPFFEQRPAVECDDLGVQQQFPCGPCNRGLMSKQCAASGRWVDLSACLGNPYDLDSDLYANELCQQDEEDPSCCGPLDCDDSEAERYPGAGDVDEDEHVDSRCGGDDCNDDDPQRWTGNTDLDRDGHQDSRCRCDELVEDCSSYDDCDDDPGSTGSRERWNGSADFDDDGHTDARCCLEDTPMCDDCDDDDPRRWSNHADLDHDGFDAASCGGDDCDDADRRRWLHHADVDGDGHVDDRCCEEGSQAACDDRNDNDPDRHGDATDLDGDEHDDARSRCDELIDDCSTFDDCDDDCPTCYPGAEASPGDARDHDCDGLVDELEAASCMPGAPVVVDVVPETGDSRALFPLEGLVYVAAAGGLYEVTELAPGDWEVSRSLRLDEARDVTVYAEHAYVATPEGLVVVDRSPDSDLVRVSGPVDAGDARGLALWRRMAYVASADGLHLLDLSSPAEPVVIGTVGPPSIDDAWDVTFDRYHMPVVSHRATPAVPFEGLTWLAGPSAYGGDEDALAYAAFSQVELDGASRLAAFFDDGTPGQFATTDASVAYCRTTGCDELELAEPRGVHVALDAMRSRKVYVASARGLEILDNRGYFISEGFVETAPARDVAVLGRLAFVATEAGLVVVDLDCEV
jgi:hypothetical protein